MQENSKVCKYMASAVSSHYDESVWNSGLTQVKCSSLLITWRVFIMQFVLTLSAQRKTPRPMSRSLFFCVWFFSFPFFDVCKCCIFCVRCLFGASMRRSEKVEQTSVHLVTRSFFRLKSKKFAKKNQTKQATRAVKTGALRSHEQQLNTKISLTMNTKMAIINWTHPSAFNREHSFFYSLLFHRCCCFFYVLHIFHGRK